MKKLDVPITYVKDRGKFFEFGIVDDSKSKDQLVRKGYALNKDTAHKLARQIANQLAKG